MPRYVASLTFPCCRRYGELRVGPLGWQEGDPGYTRFLGLLDHGGGEVELRGLVWRGEPREFLRRFRPEAWAIVAELRRWGFRVLLIERHHESGDVRMVRHEL